MIDSTLEWNTVGVGPISILCSTILIFIFRKRILGYLDPLSLYIVTRAGPTLASIVLMFSVEALFSYFYLLTIGSVFLFVITLYFATPRPVKSKASIDQVGVNKLFRIALVLSIVKLGILSLATGSLPIFGEMGSDSFIDYAENNKIGSIFLLAIASSELTLLSCLIGLTKGRKRFFIIILMIISILMHLANGKKSSLLSIMFALALGDYLRIHNSSYKIRIFTNLNYVVGLLIVAVVWAGYLFAKTPGNFELPESNIVTTILDAVFFQWAYPTYMFLSNELIGFFQVYEVNKLIYFFHTILSPLGYPAFTASIGPALHQYQTGNLSGNGINPTYLLEGYVLFGMLLPLYSVFIALLIGKVRKYINSIKRPELKIIYYSIFLPAIYVIPIDALLFMKEIIGLALLSPFLLIAFKTCKKCKKSRI